MSIKPPIEAPSALLFTVDDGRQYTLYCPEQIRGKNVSDVEKWLDSRRLVALILSTIERRTGAVA
jgi:hypothetical protein